MGDPQPSGALAGRQAAFLPCLAKCFIDGGTLHRASPEPYAPRFGCGNFLRLSLAVELPFRLRHIGQKLKHDIRNQGSGQVAVLPCIQQRHVCLCQVETKNFFLCRELSPGPAPRPMAEMMPQIFSDTLLPRLGREQDVFPFGQLDLALHILKTPIRLHQGSHETAIALQSAHRDKPESYPQRHVPCHRSGIFPRGIPRTRPQMQCA